MLLHIVEPPGPVEPLLDLGPDLERPLGVEEVDGRTLLPRHLKNGHVAETAVDPTVIAILKHNSRSEDKPD